RAVCAGGGAGGLLDHLAAHAAGLSDGSTGSSIDAAALLRALLDGLAPIWPGRIELGGVNLGDVWHHPAAGGTGSSAGLVPFHKLSQWLAYSLFEPLERARRRIAPPRAPTRPPEDRHRRLPIDLRVPL